MAYRFLDDIATADIAFRAEGKTLEEVFVSAAEATLNVMIEDISAIEAKQKCEIKLSAENEEMLLFRFLQELIYLKDADNILFRVTQVKIDRADEKWLLIAKAVGEHIDPKKHSLNVDVKAVTMHRFALKRSPKGFEATVVLDI